MLIICLEVDGDIDLGWWLALLPLWLYVTMQCLCSQMAVFTGMSLKAKKTHKVTLKPRVTFPTAPHHTRHAVYHSTSPDAAVHRLFVARRMP